MALMLPPAKAGSLPNRFYDWSLNILTCMVCVFGSLSPFAPSVQQVAMKLAPNEDKFMEVVRGTGGASLAWQVLLRFDGFQQGSDVHALHQGHSAFLTGAAFDIMEEEERSSSAKRREERGLDPDSGGGNEEQRQEKKTMGRGLLEVHLVHAKGLSGSDFLGKIDPWSLGAGARSTRAAPH